MIINYISKDRITDFANIDFMVREEPFNKRVIIDFLEKKVSSMSGSNKTISQAEIYITKDAEDIIIDTTYNGGSKAYTVLTGSDAKELSDELAQEIEKRNKNFEMLQKKLMTKSTPPQEIKLPAKTRNSDA